MSLNHLHQKVKNVTKATKDAVVITFETPEGADKSYKSGQFLTLITHLNGEEQRRSYSLCSAPGIDNSWQVAVKKVDKGLVSSYLVDELKTGDTLELLAPMGNFVYDTDSALKRHLVLFAAGSGITPLFSILKTALYKESNTIVTLVYGNRSESSIIFKAELDSLSTEFASRLRVIHCLSSPPDQWYGASGRISADLIQEVIANKPITPVHETLYYMCGPAGMMDTIVEMLNKNGVAKGFIHRESFVSAISAESIAAAIEDEGIVDRIVTINYDGDIYKFNVPADQTILEAAMDQDIDLPYSCQSGLCTACRGKCLSGSVHLDEREGLSDSEMAEGYVLTCVGRPLTDNVMIEIG